MNIFLVGTNHAHQLFGYDDGRYIEFGEYLKVEISKHHIDLICEEMSEDSLLLWKIKDSTCRSLSNTLNINHVFCDPDVKEREVLGIASHNELLTKLGFSRTHTELQKLIVDEEIRKQWPIRELYWLEKITSLNFNNCLFVFGSNHFNGFTKLLRSKGIIFNTLSSNWNG